MTGEIGAAGDLATGVLVARTVEPRTGSLTHSDGHALCLNCGTALHGAYCHGCGQAGHVHRTLGSIGHDLLHGVFHFEGKVWRTLPMLVVHPGDLTRRYIAGERARFVSPLALFLFAVFLMFATLHSFGEGSEPMDAKTRAAELAKIDARVARLSADLAKQRADDAARHSAEPSDKTIELVSEIRSLKTVRAAAAFSEGPDNTFTFTDLKTGWPALDKGIAKANANPGLAFYKLQSSAYKYSWALIPISTPFVALLFLWRRRFELYDHAIFVTYSLSFMLLLATVLGLCFVVEAPGWIVGLLLWVAPPVHMFVQLRGAYSLRKRSAAWRTVALLVFAWVALTLFGTLLLAMGLME